MPPAMYSLAMGMATLPAAAQSYAQVVTMLIPASELLRGTTAIYLHERGAPSRTRNVFSGAGQRPKRALSWDGA
jgi:hypothetical protein